MTIFQKTEHQHSIIKITNYWYFKVGIIIGKHLHLIFVEN